MGRVTTAQLSFLMDFLEGRRDLALGHVRNGIEGREESKRLWNQVAQGMRSLGLEGVEKDGAGWRLFYNDYKFKLNKKIRDMKSQISATGGGRRKKIVLSECEERLYDILGRDLGDAISGVRLNPLDVHNSMDNVTIKEVTPVATVFKKEIVPDEQSYNHLIGDVDQKFVIEHQQNPLSSNCDSTSDYDELDVDSYNFEAQNLENEMEDDIRSYPLTIDTKKIPQRAKQCSCNHSSVKHKNIIESTATIKRLYYKKKLQAAFIEKQTNMVNYKIALRKAKLIEMDLKIKQLELKSKYTKR